ncbi:hypothetical protein ACFQZ8_00250 [Micromonospora azadirachtae]|uniref:Lycopene cyclase domain-containing protein n=1 Tax=Micromonospora azadirachtae TaxID=1970735 RepID=A0ABW2ZUL5_9ACTN
MADPLWRYAEVLSIILLLAYAVVSRLPGPRWALPTALAVLLVDAVRTIPSAPGASGNGSQFLSPDIGVETAPAFESALTVCWAPLTAVLVLFLAWRRGGWHRRTAVAATTGAVLIIGYAFVRVVDIWLAIGAERRPYSTGTDTAGSMTAVGLAVLPPLALGMTALALVTTLAGHSRGLASIGAVLLALIALPLTDASIGAVPLPLHVDLRGALFAWDAITPTLSTPQPMPALTALVELTAYLLLVTGLTASSRSASALPAETHRAGPER